MRQQQWARVVNGVVVQAPGGRPDDADPAEWLPVVDVNDGPPATHTATETWVVRADRVERMWSEPVERPEVAVQRGIPALLADALGDLRAYRDLQSPTNGQTVAVVKLLCRVVSGLVRRELADFTEAP